MNKKTNYNSIVFLTTLSVYLGLVFAGGAPQISAHAALTRHFDIKNEIEFKDNLDKKPDDDLFAQTLVELVKNLDALSDNKIFDWEAKSTFTIEDLGFCESDDTPSYLGSGSINRRVDRALDEASVKIGRKLLTKKSKAGLGEFYADYPEGVTFKFSIENKNFNLDTEINTKSPEAATAFGALIDAYLSQITSSADTSSQKVIAENIKSKVDDTKILLVTHLPRASIDELLARKVAQ